jgi:hypothetical protein
MMNDKMNKTLISSIVVLDVIDYLKKSVAEQAQLKQLLMQLIQHAVLDIPQSDRVIMESSSGAAIACGGPLEDALEDALFISITIRDEILKHNSQSTLPIYAQIGINLGSVRAAGNSIVGEGIDEAQRIKRFANPNQILVSNVYFEMASKLTQEISQMFEKYEMHAHDHDVYAVRVLKESAFESALKMTDLTEEVPASSSAFNWTHLALGLLAIGAFFALAKLVITPVEPEITLVQPSPIQPAPIQTAPVNPTELEAIEEASALPESSQPEQEAIDEIAPAAVKETTVKQTQKTAEQKTVQQKSVQQKVTTPATNSTPEKTSPSATENKAAVNAADKQINRKAEKENTKEKSGWQTFKDSVTTGAEPKCTQAEIALNQCSK